MEAERPQGAKGPPFGPRCQMHGIKREGEAGLVLIIPGNGTMAKKERKMVDVIYTVCRTWTLAPPRPLEGEKKRKKEGELLGEE